MDAGKGRDPQLLLGLQNRQTSPLPTIVPERGFRSKFPIESLHITSEEKGERMGRERQRSIFSLDPSKPKTPQVISAFLQSAVIFGGPLLGMFAIERYPFLITDQSLYLGGLASISLFFLATFPLFRRNTLLQKMPLALKIVFRLGWGGCAAFLLLGIIGIANGFGTPLESREVAVVAKHQTLQREPVERTYYLAVRPWPGSRTVVELEAPRTTYDRLAVPIDRVDTPQNVLSEMPDAGQARLVIGKGRLGLDWLNTITPM